MVDGNIIFHAGMGKNITFKPGTLSGIYLDDMQISNIPTKFQMDGILMNYNKVIQRLMTLQDSMIATKVDLEENKLELRRSNEKIGNLTKQAKIMNGITLTRQRNTRKLQKQIMSLQKLLNEWLHSMEINHCDSKPCINGGQCFSAADKYFCICPFTHTGNRCEKSINECDVYKGTPKACQNNGTCVDKNFGFDCICQNGFHGELCTSRVNVCDQSSDLCGEHGHCISQTSNTLNYRCLCNYGFQNHNDTSNPYCEDIDECLNNPCYPGADCTNTIGSFSCSNCPKGTSGNGKVCMDVNECADDRLNECSKSPKVQCFNTFASYECGQCPDGYDGDGRQCTPISACFNHECHPKATCIELASNCGLTRRFSYCKNGGTCHYSENDDGDEVFSCLCRPGYLGRQCQEISKCIANDENGGCNNHGLCKSDSKSSWCECFDGFMGDDCDTETTSCHYEVSSNNGSVVPIFDLDVYDNTTRSCQVRFKIPQPDKILYLDIKYIDDPNSTEVIDTANTNFCYSSNAVVKIYDGETETSPVIGHLCETSNGKFFPQINKSIIMTGNRAFVTIDPTRFTTLTQTLQFDWRTEKKLCGGVLNSPFGEINFLQKHLMVHCMWHISVPFGKHIELTFERVEMMSQVESNCTMNSLDVYDSDIFQVNRKILSVCGNEKQPVVISTSGNTASIYWSDDIYQNVDEATTCTNFETCKLGFNLKYKIKEVNHECGGIINVSENGLFEGTLESPNYPNLYFSEIDCIWLLNASISHPGLTSYHIIDIDVLSFDVISHLPAPCSEDYLFIIHPGNFAVTSFYCNSAPVPQKLTFKQDSVIVGFHSNSEGIGKGFKLSYKSVCEQHFDAENGTIISPNYEDSANFTNIPFNCKFVIHGKRTQIMKLTFTHVGLAATFSECFRKEEDLSDIADFIKFTSSAHLDKKLSQKFVCPRYPLHSPNGQLIVSMSEPFVINYGFSGDIKNTGFKFDYTLMDIGCGGIFRQNNGTIKSPNFPEKYMMNLHCIYDIVVDRDKIVKLTFDIFDTEASNNMNLHCDSDKVEIYEGYIGPDDKGQLLGTHCGTIPPPVYISSLNTIAIVFVSDRSIQGSGFMARFEAIDIESTCDDVFTAPSGVIEYKGNNLTFLETCTYQIIIPNHKRIFLTINNATIPCHTSSLTIKNGMTDEAPSFEGIGKNSSFCGTDFPPDGIRSQGNSLFIQFRSTDPSTPQFTISYEQINSGCGGKIVGKSGAIASPQYPRKDTHGYNCEWHIYVSLGNLVQLNFIKMDELIDAANVKNQVCHIVSPTFISIHEGNSLQENVIERYCFTPPALPSITSSSNEMIIKYSQNARAFPLPRYGFFAEFKSVCKDIVLSDFNGNIQSPGYGNKVYEDSNCHWTIKVAEGNKIHVHVVAFEVHNLTRSTFIKIGRGQIESMENMPSFDESTHPLLFGNQFLYPLNDFTTLSNVLDIHYFSSGNPDNNFWLYYETVGCGGVVTENNTILEISKTNAPSLWSNNSQKPEILCQWKVNAPPGFKPKLVALEQNIYRSAAEVNTECLNGLHIYTGSNNHTGFPFFKSCAKLTNSDVESPAKDIFINLHLEDSAYDFSGKNNVVFQTTVIFVPYVADSDCGGLVNLKPGQKYDFHTLNYPNMYPLGMDCTWDFRSDAGTVIVYNITSMEPRFVTAFDHVSNEAISENITSGIYPIKQNCSKTYKEVNGFMELYDNHRNPTVPAATFCQTITEHMRLTIPTPTNSSKVHFKGVKMTPAETNGVNQLERISGLKMTAYSTCGGTLIATKKRQTYDFSNVASKTCLLTIQGDDSEDEIYTIKVKLTSIWLGTEIEQNNASATNFSFKCTTVPNSESWDFSRINFENRWYTYSCNGPISLKIDKPDDAAMHNMVLQYGVSGHFCGGNLSGNGLEQADSDIRKFQCEYTYSTAPGNEVGISIVDIKIPASENCVDGYFEIRKDNSTGPSFGRYCGTNSELVSDADHAYTSNIGDFIRSNTLWMKYYGNYEEDVGEPGPVFPTFIKFKKVTKIGGFTQSNVIESPTEIKSDVLYSWTYSSDNGPIVAIVENIFTSDEGMTECTNVLNCEGFTIAAGFCKSSLAESDNEDDCGEIVYNKKGILTVPKTLIFEANKITVLVKSLGIKPQFRISLHNYNDEFKNHQENSKEENALSTSDFNCGQILNATWEVQTLKNQVDEVGNYKSLQKCKWAIKIPLFTGLKLDIKFLDIESSTDCKFDYLYISSYDIPNSTFIPMKTYGEKRFCGSSYSAETIQYTHGSVFYIYFVTDSSRNGRGFTLDYSLICESNFIYTKENEHLNEILTSPYYPHAYPPNLTCAWEIYVTSNRQLTVFVDEVSLNTDERGNCEGDYLSIGGLKLTSDKPTSYLHDYDSESSSLYSNRFERMMCKKDIENITLDMGRTRITFVTNAEGTGSGFKLTIAEKINAYRQLDLFVDEFQPKKYITSPSFPNYTPNSVECLYRMKAPLGHRLMFTFDPTSFKLDGTEICNTDYIEVFDGPSDKSELIGRYCSHIAPPSIFSKSNYLYVKYITDSFINSVGFNATYEIADCGGSVLLTPGTNYILKSPDYNSIKLKRYDCEWTISAPPGYTVVGEILQLQFNLKTDCSLGNLTIRSHNKHGDIIHNEICKMRGLEESIINSADSFVYLRYTNDLTTQTGLATFCAVHGCGFSVEFKAMELSYENEITDDSGKIYPAGYPRRLLRGFDRKWTFKAGPSSRYILQLQFVDETDEYKERHLPNPDASIAKQRCYPEIQVHNGYVKNKLSLLNIREPFCTNKRTFISTADIVTVIYSDKFKLNEEQAVIDIQTLNRTFEYTQPFHITYTKVAKEFDPHHCMHYINSDTSIMINKNPINGSDAYTSQFCHIKIDRPHEDETILLFFTNFSVGNPKELYCNTNENYLQIESTSLLERTYDKIVCTGTHMNQSTFVYGIFGKSVDLYLYNNQITRTFFKKQDPSHFALHVRFKQCGGIVTAPQGIIQSPSYANTSSKELYSLTSQGRELTITWLLHPSEAKNRQFRLEYEYVKEDEQCGYHFFGMNGTINSPGFPNDYPNLITCLWDIRVPKGYLIQINFILFDVQGSENCEKDKLQIEEDLEHDIPEFFNDTVGFWDIASRYQKNIHNLCGSSKLPETILSTDNSIRLNFTSDSKSTGKGFKIEWKARCGGIFDGDFGSIYSPHYPSSYPNEDMECIYYISTNKTSKNGSIRDYMSGGLFLRMTDIDFYNPEHKISAFAYRPQNFMNKSACQSDYVEVFDVASKRILRSWCGADPNLYNNTPLSVSKDIGVKFVSHKSFFKIPKNENKKHRGFKMDFAKQVCSYNISTAEYAGAVTVTVQSPGYPLLYHNNLECIVNITSKPNTVLVVQVMSFDVEASQRCLFDYTEIFDGPETDTSYSLGKLCGSIQDKRLIYSTNNSMVIKFHSDQTKVHKGFQFYIVETIGPEAGCGGTLNVTDQVQTFTAPSPTSVTSFNLNNLNCGWNLRAPQDKVIKIKISDFDLPPKNSGTLKCVDYLTIFDGEKNVSPMMAEMLCDYGPDENAFTISFVSSHRKAYVYFHSEHPSYTTGFKIEYSAVDPDCGGTYLAGPDMQTLLFNRPNKIITTLNKHLRCRYYLYTQNNAPMEIHFHKFKVLSKTTACTDEYLEISDAGNIVECSHPSCATNEGDKRSFKYCGSERPPYFISNTPVVQLTLSHNLLEGDNDVIEIKYHELGSCNRTIEIDNSFLEYPSSRLTSPNYPKPYGHNAMCITKFTAADNQMKDYKILFVFRTFSLERSSFSMNSNLKESLRYRGAIYNRYRIQVFHSSKNKTGQAVPFYNGDKCRYDYLELVDHAANYTSRRCDLLLPRPYLTGSENVSLIFKTDSTTQAVGYDLTYFVAKPLVTRNFILYDFKPIHDTHGAISNFKPIHLNKTVKMRWTVKLPRGNQCKLVLTELDLGVNASHPKCSEITNQVFSIHTSTSEYISSDHPGSSLDPTARLLNVPCKLYSPKEYQLNVGDKFVVEYKEFVGDTEFGNTNVVEMYWKCESTLRPHI
uniref:Cubilin n=1 Tax=Rhabditophanes sp. KR3021 TaxID=114890 RepID=A0AC35TNA3_9BILA